MKGKVAILICVTVLIFCQSCRMLDVLAGSESAGTVDRLWTDVPPVDGAQKADLAIPLVSRLIIRTLTQGRVNFIAFTTPRTAVEIQNIYSNERMKAAGWTPANGCVSDSEANQGAVCVFIRENEPKENGLAIIIAEDPEKKETHIFYARFDLVDEEQKRSVRTGAGKQ